MEAESVRKFRDLALLELKRAERYRNFLSLLILNLSEFLATAGRRRINSPEKEQEFMGKAVHRIRHSARETDIISPLRDSRLAMLLPETDDRGAQMAASRFRAIIGELMGEILESDYDFEIPLEVASFPGKASEKSLKMRLTDIFVEN
jgi:GGDEF domain-containing protein